MTVGLIFDGVGVSPEQYSQVLNAVFPDGQRAPGLLSHHAGPTEGGFCVVEIWESQEALQQFFDWQRRTCPASPRYSRSPTRCNPR